jgi:hypothetical protein
MRDYAAAAMRAAGPSYRASSSLRGEDLARFAEEVLLLGPEMLLSGEQHAVSVGFSRTT